jgi:hypothetical protein
MSSIIKGLIDESESVSVIYIDGKPSTKYTNAVEAKKDADRLRVKFPNKKIEVKQEMREGSYKPKEVVMIYVDGEPKLFVKDMETAKQHLATLKNKFPNKKFELKSEMHETKQRLDPKCWKGKHKEGTKIKGGVRVNNCVPNESVEEADEMCESVSMNKRWIDPDYPAVGYQEGGWRQVKLKPAGQLDEFDSFDNATSYRVHPAGELDEGDVVPFKKKKTEYDKYKDAFSKQHDDEHRHGVGWIECDYCGDVNCDYDCDGSQADGELEEDTSYGGGMGQGGYAGQSYRKFKPKMAGTNMKKSSILKGITGESE